MKIYFTWLYGILMILAGINHFVKPYFYKTFIPNWLPLLPVNYVTGAVEATLGVCLLIPVCRHYGALGLFLLMIVFLPLHAFDVFKQNPAIGSKLLAYIRLPLQFILIWWAWSIFRNQ
nr:MauE/DoxX family redox-associated membrane protein [uncultured Pedobacter sp.]